jgi:hypothetical protein
MTWLDGKLDNQTMGLYVVAQLCGAYAALWFYNHVITHSLPNKSE